ncbi:hypothetical protein E2C01_058656 [Portunus trituberculatus]|uniref:Uncharacterized protein n=1 Tax=Portunus trituberculatus TaxID=210409 RepID=A0A5B7H5B2_PORTR|nr:hypothetical protein [Portunus trituberculatus]
MTNSMVELGEAAGDLGYLETAFQQGEPERRVLGAERWGSERRQGVPQAGSGRRGGMGQPDGQRGRSNVRGGGGRRRRRLERMEEMQKASGRVEITRQVATHLSAFFSQSSPSTLQTPWRRQGFLAEGARDEYDGLGTAAGIRPRSGTLCSAGSKPLGPC